jgi:hypothetical protein
LDALEHAARRGDLTLSGRCQDLAAPQPWQHFLGTLRRTEWVVYAKEPLQTPQHVLQYLARYTHRVAISNQRLVALEQGKVTFRWKDYKQGNAIRLMTLDAVEFIRRFLLHVLPRGFQRIRHFGFLANRVRQAKLAVCRALLPPPAGVPPVRHLEAETPQVQDDPGLVCPACQCGRMYWVETLRPQPAPCARDRRPAGWDTS